VVLEPVVMKDEKKESKTKERLRMREREEEQVPSSEEPVPDHLCISKLLSLLSLFLTPLRPPTHRTDRRNSRFGRSC